MKKETLRSKHKVYSMHLREIFRVITFTKATFVRRLDFVYIKIITTNKVTSVLNVDLQR